MERRQESTAVKEALRKEGIPVKRVKHGTGTAHGWLKIYLTPMPYGDEYGWLCRRAVKVAQDVTGRHGEYDGRINVCC